MDLAIVFSYWVGLISPTFRPPTWRNRVHLFDWQHIQNLFTSSEAVGGTDF